MRHHGGASLTSSARATARRVVGFCGSRRVGRPFPPKDGDRRIPQNACQRARRWREAYHSHANGPGSQPCGQGIDDDRPQGGARSGKLPAPDLGEQAGGLRAPGKADPKPARLHSMAFGKRSAQRTTCAEEPGPEGVMSRRGIRSVASQRLGETLQGARSREGQEPDPAKPGAPKAFPTNHFLTIS